MPLALYMDHQISRSITAGLRTRQIDVLTAYEDGMHEAADDILLKRASQLQRLLFSQDDDLIREATKLQQEETAFYGVVYAHQLRVPIGDCIRDLQLIATVGDPEEVINRILFLPLRS